MPIQMPLFSAGQIQTVSVDDPADASSVGRYMSAVGQFLETNDDSLLEQFRGESVTDIGGFRHYFEIRPNVVYRLTASQTESFEEVYKIV